MKNNFKLFLLFLGLLFWSSCQTEEAIIYEGINGPWKVNTWTENGTSDSDVLQYKITLSFTNVTNGAGIMTFKSSVVPFNYTGNFSLDSSNLLTATLDETSGNMEINQWILSMDATIGSDELVLDGSMLKKSPFWPDTTSTVIFKAAR